MRTRGSKRVWRLASELGWLSRFVHCAKMGLLAGWLVGRCHCVALVRGATVDQVIAELFGFKEGVASGKGGSMHLYNKEYNFYGGQGR